MGLILICGFNALALLMTDLYVKGLWSFGPYRRQPLGGPLYSVFTLLFFWCTLHGFWIVIRSYRSTQGLHRKQLALFLWATAVPYFGGASLFLQAYQIPVPLEDNGGKISVSAPTGKGATFKLEFQRSSAIFKP